MAKIQEIGPYSAYAIAVKYGYKGTEEEWVKEQEANRKAAEAAAAAAAQSAKDADASASGVAQSGQQAVQGIKDAQTAAEQAIDTAKQQAVQAAQAEAEKAATSAGQAASSAAEAAQSATNAAAEVGKVQSAGTSAVQAVQAAQNTATEAVSAAQQTATQAVSEAQATAVSAVQEAGTTQTSAVASAASSALTNISGAKDAALSDVAEAGAAQVSAVGTAGADAVEDVNDAKTAALEAIDAANAALPAPTQSDAGKVPAVKADGSAYELAGPYAPLSAAIRPTANGNSAVCEDSIAWSFQGLRIYGKSTQDGTPSPDNPVPIVSAGEGGNVEIKVTGSNLIPRPYFDSDKKTTYGITFSTNNDGSITCVGTASGEAYYNLSNNSPGGRIVLPPGNYIAKFVAGENVNCAVTAINVSDSSQRSVGYGKPFELLPGEELNVFIYVMSGRSVNTTAYVSISPGLTDLPYEPYKVQSLHISTPNGLPGIPVDSGGNYTDVSGQRRWVCDVKNYGTGKYTQMVGHIESYNDENITTPHMSTTGQLSAGAEVYYVLDEPVVTDISADELAAYRTLHTYDGATVVSTAEDVAGIEVKYLADGEKYIDRKISEGIASAAETKLAAYDTLSGAIHEGVNEA